LALKIEWKAKDTLALLIIPMEFALTYILSEAFTGGGNMIVLSLIPFCLKLFSAALIVAIYRGLLAEHWNRFIKRLWLKLICCAAAAASLSFVLSGVRSLAGIAQSADIMAEVTGGLPYCFFLMAAFAPVWAPVTEELLFRHILFYKFSGRKTGLFLTCVASAFLFGAVHLGNFGGDLLLTIPYMAIAILYNLIYYFTKNIWYSIAIHLMFNFAQSVFPALLIPFLIAGMS
jgi:membrane protease YdiL (CAAX protease family)